MDNRRQCPQCLFDIEADDPACPSCGAVLTTVPLPSAAFGGRTQRPALKACPDCGSAVSARAELCSQCGCPPENKRRPTGGNGRTVVSAMIGGSP